MPNPRAAGARPAVFRPVAEGHTLLDGRHIDVSRTVTVRDLDHGEALIERLVTAGVTDPGQPDRALAGDVMR